MAYILNLVLGCWVNDDEDENIPGVFLSRRNKDIKNLHNLVKHWNNSPNKWNDIHYPAIVGHFEVYDKLPANWRSYDKAEVSNNE
jgi:hypothetical protein